MARELNVAALISVNYYFVFLHALESALKVLLKLELYLIKITIHIF